jgi:hypothetical protein
MPEETLAQQLVELGGRPVSSLIGKTLPKRIVAAVLDRSGIATDVTGAELPKAARQKLIESLKRLPIKLSGTRGYAKAEVTAGGVRTNEVNPKTMQSRIVDGLFFAGEILDFDGPIGGFNFQAAFSTGHLAALNVKAGSQKS